MCLELQTATFWNITDRGDPKTGNGGMTERRNGGKSPQILKRGMAENPKTRNGGKSPHILKRGTAENHP